MSVEPDFEQAPSGWWILWRRLNPFQSALKLPSIFEIVHRTDTLASSRAGIVNRDFADLMIVPPVGHIGILDFKPFDAIIEAGYRKAVQALRRATDPRLARYLRGPDLAEAAVPHEPVAAMARMGPA